MTWYQDWFDDAVIDLRPADRFQQGHIKDTTSLPWERLPASMHELPDRDRKLKLVGDSASLSSAQAFLRSKEYVVADSIETTDAFWTWANTVSLVEQGCHTVPLWQANPFLVEHIGRIESATTGRSGLDLACGAGRDTVWLASRGWQMTAIDAKADALSRCQSLAESMALEVACRQLDLEQEQPALTDLAVDLILVMRYLHRPLLPMLKDLLNPGGIICYSTFMVGCEQFGSPRNPNYLLQHGELARQFSDFEILVDEERNLTDGRPVAVFLARKVARKVA